MVVVATTFLNESNNIHFLKIINDSVVIVVDSRNTQSFPLKLVIICH